MEKTKNNEIIELRHIKYGELHLMFSRLVIDVQEHPENYIKGEGITEFIEQENFRRSLFEK